MVPVDQIGNLAGFGAAQPWTHSVGEFCEAAYADANLDYREYGVVDEHFYRPAEVDLLVGDSSKARRALGWEPKITFRVLVREMVREEIARH